MLPLVACFSALGVFLIFAAIAGLFRDSNRMDKMVMQYSAPKLLEEIELAKPFTVRVVEPFFRALARNLARLSPQYFAEATRQKLEFAGNPFSWTVLELSGFRVLSSLLTAVFLFILFGALGLTPALAILLSVAGFILGFYIPMLWLTLRVRTRQQAIQRTLPDALDLLTICVQAGLSFDAALAQLAEKWNNEISRLFGRALIEMRLGKVRQVALRDMANRTGVKDVSSFVASIIQADQLGVPISKVLRIQSEQMRVLRRQRAQTQANQIPIKIIFPLVFFIFPSMFIVILGPALVRIFLQGLFG